MPTLLIAAASALLLAALVTETTQRFWPNSYLALLIITFIALLVNGLFNARLKQSQDAPKEAKPKGNRNQERGQRNNRDRGNQKGRSNNANRKEGNRDSKQRGGNRDSNKRSYNERSQNERQQSERPKNQKPQNERPNAEPKESAQSAKEIAPREPEESGTVKWFNRSKGYGFIIRDNGDEVFVHQRSIVSDDDKQRPVLRDGQKVRFEVAHLEKGAQAENVKGVD